MRRHARRSCRNRSVVVPRCHTSQHVSSAPNDSSYRSLLVVTVRVIHCSSADENDLAELSIMNQFFQQCFARLSRVAGDQRRSSCRHLKCDTSIVRRGRTLSNGVSVITLSFLAEHEPHSSSRAIKQTDNRIAKSLSVSRTTMSNRFSLSLSVRTSPGRRPMARRVALQYLIK